MALVKPQFEVGKELLPSDGVVKSEQDRGAVLADIREFVEAKTPWKVVATMQSPVEGEKGNVEFLVHLR